MDDDDDGSLADRIHAAFERGAADARHAEVTLAKLVRDALLAFAVAMEMVDPHAIPACLEELAEATGLEPELDALTDELFEEAARRRREAAS